MAPRKKTRTRRKPRPASPPSKKPYRLAFYLALICICLPYPVCAAEGQAEPAKTGIPYTNRDDDELLILSLDLGEIRLMDDFLVYEDLENGEYYVPLADFVEAIEFPITITPESGTAQGWFIQESRTFALDLGAQTVTIGGKTQKLSENDAERHRDGIYVSLRFLEKTFPVTVDIDYNDLKMVIKSLEPLPVEIKRARDQQRSALLAKNEREMHTEYPLEEIKAPFFSIPYLDTSTQITHNTAADQTSRTQLSTTMIASGIAAGQDTSFRMNDTTGDTQSPDIRLTMGRKDPQGDLLGAGLSEYSFGDVNTASIPTISRGNAGRGISVSTMPLDTGSVQSNTVKLRGELPVGYQADISQNGQLIGFIEQPDANGEYIFDVNVLPGLNVFEISLYGPQGQKETREERIYQPVNPVKAGSFGFKTSLIQDNTNLFTDRTGNDEDTGKARFTTEAAYGLSDNSSLYSAIASMPIEGKQENFGLLRYSRSFKGIRADLTYSRAQSGGHIGTLALQGIFRGLRWQMEHAALNAFTSEETLQSTLVGPLTRTSKLRMSGVLPIFKNTPFSLNLDRAENETGDSLTQIQARTTHNIGKLRVTPQINRNISSTAETKTDLALQLSSRYRNIGLRGVIGYTLTPDSALRNISLNADWRYNDLTTFNLGLSRIGSDDPLHTLSLGASRTFKHMKIGANISYNDDREVLALLSSSFGFGINPLTRSPYLTSQRFANQSVFVPRVFYDMNNNQIKDSDEDYLEDISFLGSGIDRNATTNAQGHSVITAPSYERTSVRINPSTLDDPYLASLTPPKDYILRPGQTVQKDFPIILVGEADGQIYTYRQGKKMPAASILFDITAQDGNFSTQAKSEYDGFLMIQTIPVGEYLVQPNLAQLEELGYCGVPAQKLSLDHEEPFASLDDFTLFPNANAEGTVNLILGQNTNAQDAIDLWENLRPTIEDIAQDTKTTPVAYILHDAQDTATPYHLVLYDINPDAFTPHCEAITAQGGLCEIKKPECPDAVIEISQLSAAAVQNADSDYIFHTEDFNEDALIELDLEEVEKLIDN